MRRVLAWFFGEGFCPACEGSLSEVEAGHHVCESCGVVVDFTAGGWRFHSESELRRLPGLAGSPFDKRAA